MTKKEKLKLVQILKENEGWFRILSKDDPQKTYQYFISKSVPLEDVIRLLKFLSPFIGAIQEDQERYSQIAEQRDDLELKDYKINEGRKSGNLKGNLTKETLVSERRKLIADYLVKNPKPNLKSYSLEGYLIKTLQLKNSKGNELTEKTVKNDLKKLKKKIT